jgi:hypothetical protein
MTQVRMSPAPSALWLLRKGRRLGPVVAYAALALVVASGLLASGFVLLPDLNQTPNPGIPSSYWGLAQGTHEGSPARLPLDALFAGLGEIGAVQVGQKLLLVAIVFLAGLGMHRLVRTRSSVAAGFAGLLYAINPFVYDRLDTGQWFLLLGYALIPHAYRAFRSVLEGRPRAPWAFGALFLATAISSTHMAALLALLCVTTLVAWMRRLARLETALTPVLAAIALAVLPSLYWLIPTPGLEAFWSQIGKAQLALYRTLPDPHFGLVVNVAGLYGYWNNDFPIKSYLSVWPLFAFAMPLLAIAGAVVQRRDPTTWGVLAAGVLGFLLALGDASVLTRGAFTWLLDHVSSLRSFREPQKGVALLAFAYAFLGAAAIDDLVTGPGQRRRTAYALSAVALAFPLIAGYRMLGGLWGDLKLSQFPASWSQADHMLEGRAPQSRTLFLPWHGYFALRFAHDRVVGNLAPTFFHTPILASRSVGDEPGINDTADPTESYVRSLLSRGASVRRFGACLAPLGVQYVLLAKEADWRRYAFLDRRSDVAVVRRWPDLVLYRLGTPAGLAMAAPDHARGCSTGLRPLPVEKLSPVRYRISAAPPRVSSVVIGLPQPRHWRLEGRDVFFTRWPEYRRNYILGLAGGLVSCGSLLLALARRTRGLR